MLQYADGYAYSKTKFDDGLRIILADKPAKPAKAHSNVKKEDVDLIVSELEIPRAQAERALADNNGDLAKTLQALITP
jgi:NACalpha-BTF3-like transcription factor